MNRSTICILLAVFVGWPGSGSLAYAAPDDPDRYAPVSGIPEGARLIEGDILISEEEYEQLARGITPLGLFKAEDKLWPNGIVPYNFSSNVTATNQARARLAMDRLEAVASIRFIERDVETAYIRFRNSDNNSSYVGRLGVVQYVLIYNWDRNFIIVHELMHALGMWHEHSRGDRGTYITINSDNIEFGESSNFDMHADGFMYGPYDFDSLMHYGNKAFAVDTNEYTIVVKEPWNVHWQDAIGQRRRISEIDKLSLQMMYPRTGEVFIDQAYTGSSSSGTYFEPYKTFPAGAAVVPDGGRAVIQPGAYPGSAGVYSVNMAVYAPLGGVILKP